MTNKSDPILTDLVKKVVHDCMDQMDKTLKLMDLIDDYDADTDIAMRASLLFSVATNFAGMTVDWVSSAREGVETDHMSPKEYQKKVEIMLTVMGKNLVARHADYCRDRQRRKP